MRDLTIAQLEAENARLDGQLDQLLDRVPPEEAAMRRLGVPVYADAEEAAREA